MQSFDIEQRDLGSGCCELSVHGELDLAVAPRLEEAIDATKGFTGVVVALGHCDFLDSTGIAVLVQAHERLAAEGRALVVCCPVEQPQRVLVITGLIDRGLVFGTLDEAVEALRESFETGETAVPEVPA